MSHPIQVSPGRYVNLSGAPLPPVILLRQKIRMILFACKFTHNISNFQEHIAQAIVNSFVRSRIIAIRVTELLEIGLALKNLRVGRVRSYCAFI